MARHNDYMNAVAVEVVPSLTSPAAAFAIEKEARDMGSSWSRRDRIIRLAKLRGDRAALAIMGAGSLLGSTTDIGLKPSRDASNRLELRDALLASVTESELRALWGDR